MRNFVDICTGQSLEFLVDDSGLSVELVLAVLLRGLPLPPLVEAAAGLPPPQLGEVARHHQLAGASAWDVTSEMDVAMYRVDKKNI